MKLMKEKSEAFIALMKDEVPKRSSRISPSPREEIAVSSQIASIVSRVPAKVWANNILQKPLYIHSFLYSIMGLAMIFLYVKILFLEGRIKAQEEKQNQVQM